MSAIRRATGATVTDAVLAALTACLRDVLTEAAGEPPRHPLLTFIPVMSGPPSQDPSLTSHEGNAVSGILIGPVCS